MLQESDLENRNGILKSDKKSDIKPHAIVDRCNIFHDDVIRYLVRA